LVFGRFSWFCAQIYLSADFSGESIQIQHQQAKHHCPEVAFEETITDLQSGKASGSNWNGRIVCEDSPARENGNRCALDIFGTKARLFGDTCQHTRTDFLTIMECENAVWPIFSGQGTVRSRLALHSPADSQKSRQQSTRFNASPSTHAALNEMLRRSGPASPCSRRSAKTRSASACAFARASSGLSP
jgi:hypothetical protein